MSASTENDPPDPERPRGSDNAAWTPVRRELWQWFDQHAPSLCPLYKAAVQLVHDPGFPARYHLISHAVRDIINVLPQVLEGARVRPRIDYHHHVRKIAKRWPQASVGIQRGSGADRDEKLATADTVAIPRDAFVEVDTLVRVHLDQPTQRQRDAILLRALMRANAAPAIVSRRLAEDFEAIRKWFMRYAHARADDLPSLSDGDFADYFERFERTLHSFVGHFFTGTKELDDILAKANRD